MNTIILETSIPGWPIILAAVVVVLILVLFCIVPMGMWISAVASGVKINIFSLVGMKIRRVKPARIVAPMIKATKAGLKVKTNELEAHYLAGGDVDSVINALIAAERAGIALTFE
ncbi:MAG: flotillin-like FloA family protein, partial [Lachnospiraceae bacterium]|nr:flotillin-like FloA family protein [Lachnospiraceae bacterium]